MRNVKKKGWKTIDYIGGGFVLQAEHHAVIEKKTDYEGNFKEATFTEKPEPAWTADVYGNVGDGWASIEGFHQKHRVVHISELPGVDMGDMVSRVENRESEVATRE